MGINTLGGDGDEEVKTETHGSVEIMVPEAPEVPNPADNLFGSPPPETEPRPQDFAELPPTPDKAGTGVKARHVLRTGDHNDIPFVLEPEQVGARPVEGAHAGSVEISLDVVRDGSREIKVDVKEKGQIALGRRALHARSHEKPVRHLSVTPLFKGQGALEMASGLDKHLQQLDKQSAEGLEMRYRAWGVIDDGENVYICAMSKSIVATERSGGHQVRYDLEFMRRGKSEPSRFFRPSTWEFFNGPPKSWEENAKVVVDSSQSPSLSGQRRLEITRVVTSTWNFEVQTEREGESFEAIAMEDAEAYLSLAVAAFKPYRPRDESFDPEVAEYIERMMRAFQSPIELDDETRAALAGQTAALNHLRDGAVNTSWPEVLQGHAGAFVNTSESGLLGLRPDYSGIDTKNRGNLEKFPVPDFDINGAWGLMVEIRDLVKRAQEWNKNRNKLEPVELIDGVPQKKLPSSTKEPPQKEPGGTFELE